MSKRFMVIDDDPVIRTLITEMVTSLGHSVQTAESGTDAISRLGAECPDIIILDFQMPDMTGLDVLTRIRENPATQGLPVIMLSANSSAASLSEAKGVAADCYLEKPFKMGDFVSAIKSLAVE